MCSLLLCPPFRPYDGLYSAYPTPHFSDAEDPLRLTNETRTLGLIVCRGTSVMLVAPSDGTEEIENPFLAA